MKNIKSLLYKPLLTFAAAALALFFIAAPPMANASPKIKFVSAEDVVKGALAVSHELCVPRLPMWELSASEGTYNGFAARKACDDCSNIFAKEVRDFTDEEKETLTRYAALIDSIAAIEFPALKRVPWNFVVMSDSGDIGVPSSDKYIILTKSMVADLRDWMDKQTRLFFMGIEILIHERVRLLQVSAPQPFERFYRENWGFRKIAPLSIDDRMMQDNGFHILRVPPLEWITKATPRDKEFFMPALLLRSADKNGGGTVQRIAITIDSTSKGYFPRKSKRQPVEYRDLRFISQYRRKFPLSDYDHHPHELSADLIAKLMVSKYVSVRYGTAQARISDYSQIDVLMRYVNESKSK